MKMKKIIKKIVKWGVFTTPLWPIWVWGLTDLVEKVYPNIKTQQEAYQILGEEKNKLGMRDSIDLRIYENNELREFGVQGYAGKLSKENSLIIGVNRRDLSRILLRHELYHLHKEEIKPLEDPNDETKEGALNYYRKLRKGNKLLGTPKHFFLMEPRANIYSITGIKF